MIFAVLAAAAGHRVTVLERLPFVGGRTSSLEAGGFRFDLGPTFFLYPRVLEEIFASAGADLNSSVPMTRLDPQYRLVFGAKEASCSTHLDATPDIARMEQEIARISPSDAAGFKKFLAENRDKLAAFQGCMQSPFTSWSDIITPKMLGLLPHLKPHLDLDKYLQGFFKDPRIRTAFSFQSKYLGMAPFRCPSLFSILSFLEYEYGVYHPTGGCAAVTAALADLARSLGVRIKLHEPVTGMTFEKKRVTGVTSVQQSYRADAVIMNADFARGMKRLVPNELRASWTDQKIAKKKFSCSTFMLYLGVMGLFLACLITRFASLPTTKKIYRKSTSINRHTQIHLSTFRIACVTDPTLAPSGKSTLYLLAPVSNQLAKTDWKTEAPRLRKRLLQEAAALGYEDLEKRITFEKIITPDDWEADYEIHLGATFNLAHTLPQMLHLRPQNRFKDISGLYLTGGGTHPGSGLPVIFESARITTRLMLEDMG
ncbi:MAG: phytoene desaturase [Akkermansiaceae bacterium]|nr:phytoene desaturase [Akkermansiaceae bacterium]